MSELTTLENKGKLILEYQPEDLREDIKRELDGVKEQETQWYPETFSVWQDLHLDLSGDGSGPRFPMGLTLHPSSNCSLLDTLVRHLRCFTNLNYACYSYQHDMMPARYRNLFRSVDSHKIHPGSDPTERFALVNAHTGMEIFMGALAAFNTNVRTMELAVKTEEPDAFITSLPVDIVARACHKVENLVLKNSLQNYYKLQDQDDREPRIVLEQSTFPALRSLTIDGFSANTFYGSSEYVPRQLPTAIPPISHLTIRANNLHADPLLQFLHRYAGHVHDLVFESVGGSCFTRVLGVLNSISLGRLEIRSRGSEDWRQYLEQAEGQKNWVMQALLQGMPRDLLLSSAKTVVLEPYFRQALDEHWQ